MKRLKPPTQGVNSLMRRPPNGLLPDNIIKLYEEHQRLLGEHGTAHNAAADMNARWADLEAEARRLDATEAGQRARSGGDVSATPQLDALRRRRDEANQRANALAEAIAIVSGEIRTAAWEWQSSGGPGKSAVDAARKLEKAAQAFRQALEEASKAVAVIEWTAGHPYSSSAFVPVPALRPVEAQVAHGGAFTEAVDGLALIDAITDTITSALTEWSTS